MAAAIGRAFEGAFGCPDNPWHQLGALGFYLFWIIAATGVYVYAFFDTSASGAWSSVEKLSREQWYAGGVMRSVHRYASDALVVVMALHLLREILRGHWRDFRWFSWLSGVPLIWLVYAAGIGGYWLVWDQLGQFSITATAEWLDRLPLGAESIIRNFIYPIDDRFFSLLIFLHIGIPLLLLAGMWIHIQRISHVDTLPTRGLAAGVLAMLLVLALVHPATSHAPADSGLLESNLDLDWFYLFIHPLQYATSAGTLWTIAAGATLVLASLPLFGRTPARAVAQVNPQYCNGCARCADDCPYAAISMRPRTGGRSGQRLPQVVADACAGCGICAGACPSSTPFRSIEQLVTGIDMPQRPVQQLRTELENALARAAASGRSCVVVFGCERAADLSSLGSEQVVVMGLLCAAMLPPSFVEYGLRGGASAVIVNACRAGECDFRLGTRWMRQRLCAEREPHLRSSVSPAKFLFTQFRAGEEEELGRAAAQLVARTSTSASPVRIGKRRASRHG